MSSNTPNPIINCNTAPKELFEEYQRQSALASSADRTDIDLIDFLDQALMDAE
jgi:hypothetical protein